MTLYLKYRPQTVDELDLTQAREAMKRLLSSEDIPHAFLFSGPKGIGKTSAARILAKAVNCETRLKKQAKSKEFIEPCNKCEQCIAITKGRSMDVIELDAASNRGIDDVRTLRENVNLAPASARRKVYIIDEAHMLTTEAANAFLKTLEEPPGHAIFILATTDPQKLPATVHSRLANVPFVKASPEEIARQLTRVSAGEGVAVEDGVYELIAKAADGSFRDAVKVFESLATGNKKITMDAAEQILESVQDQGEKEFIKKLAKKDVAGALADISKLTDKGGSVRLFTDKVITGLRGELLAIATGGVAVYGIDKQDLVELIVLLIDARSAVSRSPIPELPLEVVVVRWCGNVQVQKTTEPKALKAKKMPETADTNKENVNTQEIESKNSTEELVISKGEVNGDHWTRLVMELRARNTTVDALLRAAEPLEFSGNSLKLGVFYRFHKERLETNQYKRLIEDVATDIAGRQVKVSYVLSERKSPPKRPEQHPADSLTDTDSPDIIQAAKEIFGN